MTYDLHDIGIHMKAKEKRMPDTVYNFAFVDYQPFPSALHKRLEDTRFKRELG